MPAVVDGRAEIELAPKEGKELPEGAPSTRMGSDIPAPAPNA